MNSGIDWTLWRSFAAVAEHGSLSGAARALRLSQPTLGRHIETLQRDLGVRLFERSAVGLVATELGLRAYEPVKTAREALAAASLYAAGASAELAGSVRITASVVASHSILPPMIAALRREHREIALELVPSDSPENLLMREADIAVRMFRPTQLDLVTKKIGETPIVACAHQSYLARRGTPKTIEELADHDLIGFDRSTVLIEGARSIGFELEREDFAVRCDGQSVLWELLKAGAGIGFAQDRIARGAPGVEILDIALDLPPLEIWLTCHKELFTARRIRIVYDRLATMIWRWLAGRDIAAAGPDRGLARIRANRP